MNDYNIKFRKYQNKKETRLTYHYDLSQFHLTE